MSWENLPGTSSERNSYRKWLKRHFIDTSGHIHGNSQNTKWSSELVNHYKWWCSNRQKKMPTITKQKVHNQNSSPLAYLYKKLNITSQQPSLVIAGRASFAYDIGIERKIQLFRCIRPLVRTILMEILKLAMPNERIQNISLMADEYIKKMSPKRESLNNQNEIAKTKLIESFKNQFNAKSISAMEKKRILSMVTLDFTRNEIEAITKMKISNRIWWRAYQHSKFTGPDIPIKYISSSRCIVPTK